MTYICQTPGRRSVRSRSTLFHSHPVLCAQQPQDFEHDLVWQPPSAHSDERPRPQRSLLAHNVVPMLSHSVIPRALLFEAIRWSSLLRCAAKQDPVVYGVEVWSSSVPGRVHVLHPYRRATIVSAFIIRVLRESDTLSWSSSSRRYHLMRIQHARVRLVIQVDMSRVSVMAPSRQGNNFTCL